MSQQPPQNPQYGQGQQQGYGQGQQQGYTPNPPYGQPQPGYTPPGYGQGAGYGQSAPQPTYGMNIPPGYGNLARTMITSGLDFDGYKIVHYLGIVRGITVRSRSVFGSIGASFQQLAGGNISLYTELCEKAREEAFELMMQHAAAMGATAILSFRYDANEISDGVTEVLAYGTAVIMERKEPQVAAT